MSVQGLQGLGFGVCDSGHRSYRGIGLRIRGLGFGVYSGNRTQRFCKVWQISLWRRTRWRQLLALNLNINLRNP